MEIKKFTRDSYTDFCFFYQEVHNLIEEYLLIKFPNYYEFRLHEVGLVWVVFEFFTTDIDESEFLSLEVQYFIDEDYRKHQLEIITKQKGIPLNV